MRNTWKTSIGSSERPSGRPWRVRRAVAAVLAVVAGMTLGVPGIVVQTGRVAAVMHGVPAVAAAPTGATANLYIVAYTFDTPGDCTLSPMHCTLREAITASNAHPPGPGNTNLIQFDIQQGCDATTHVCTISPTSPLPTISQAVVIDGYSQPGSSPNTLPLSGGTNAGLRIELNGLSAGVASGLAVSPASPDSTLGTVIQGLAINRFSVDGVTVAQNAGATVRGNFIGTNATGTAALPNSYGVSVLGNQSSTTTIGGTRPADRNLLSGNTNSGIHVYTGFGTLVQGNLIGTNATGAAAVPNRSNGVYIDQARSINVGGGTAGAGNVISGNAEDGIRLEGSGATFNLIKGNLLGTSANQSAPLPNTGHGILMRSGATSNTVGGTLPGEGNVIAFNGSAGVAVGNEAADSTTTGNAILSNRIYGNGGLGIDLGNNSVTQNDQLDADPGPNHFQNFPVLVSATSTNAGTSVVGVLNSTPSHEFRIQFFANPSPDPSSLGEGQTFLGETTMTADALGDARFTFTTTNVVPGGQYISATATDLSTADTSEFAADVIVRQPAAPTSTSTPTATATGSKTPTPTNTATGTATAIATNTATRMATTPPATATQTPSATPNVAQTPAPSRTATPPGFTPTPTTVGTTLPTATGPVATATSTTSVPTTVVTQLTATAAAVTTTPSATVAGNLPAGAGTPAASSTPTPVVPEPSPFLLFGSGLLLLGAGAHKLRRRQR